jgi:protein phosphatase
MFPTWSPVAAGGQRILLDGRFVIREQLARRGNVTRYLAWDESTNQPKPVQLIRTPRGNTPTTDANWPSLNWEVEIRARLQVPGLPRIIERISSECADYLVLELPEGPNLWDAWDDPGLSTCDKFTWLIHLAELLTDLHNAGVILESLRPDQVILTADGHVLLADFGSLLPLTLPDDALLTPTKSTAPEILAKSQVDARADLYCFGALLYSLLLGRELSDADFMPDGRPLPFLERFPDVHPLLGRVIAKTFCPDRARRFPSGESMLMDATGFQDLVLALELCQNSMSRARLDVAAWSNTGMSRSGNEDTFAVAYSTTGASDLIGDAAVILVADGMGGSAAGEIAATIAVREMYKMLADLVPAAVFRPSDDHPPSDSDSGLPEHGQRSTEHQRIRSQIVTAIKHANRQIRTAAAECPGHFGMGCTAEVVYIDGRHITIGHVGDSRTYRFRRGRLALLTRDHTYVSRLVEFGEITPEEAETHPRRAELQQALGGWAEVEPDVLDVAIEAGDWVLVCSDGLTGIVKPLMIQNILEKATSADDAARRLINLANHLGSPDNVTVAVIRAV